MDTILRTKNGYSVNRLECTGLPAREAQVLLLKALGLTTMEAAKELGCGARTVRNRLESLFYKLSAKNAVQLINNAYGAGNLRMLSILFTASITAKHITEFLQAPT